MHHYLYGKFRTINGPSVFAIGSGNLRLTAIASRYFGLSGVILGSESARANQ